MQMRRRGRKRRRKQLLWWDGNIWTRIRRQTEKILKNHLNTNKLDIFLLVNKSVVNISHQQRSEHVQNVLFNSWKVSRLHQSQRGQRSHVKAVSLAENLLLFTVNWWINETRTGNDIMSPCIRQTCWRTAGDLWPPLAVPTDCWLLR